MNLHPFSVHECLNESIEADKRKRVYKIKQTGDKIKKNPYR